MRPRYKIETTRTPIVRNPAAPKSSANVDNEFFQGVDPHSSRGAQLTRRAAVLMPLCLDQGIPSILLIRRSRDMRHHSGQVAFPGGIYDESDDYDPVKCALREANEEIGLEKEDAEILGLHHDCTTQDRSKNTPGTVITPVVAFLKRDVSETHFKLSEAELDMLFAVPLHRLAQLAEWTSFRDRPSFPFTIGNVHVIDRNTVAASSASSQEAVSSDISKHAQSSRDPKTCQQYPRLAELLDLTEISTAYANPSDNIASTSSTFTSSSVLARALHRSLGEQTQSLSYHPTVMRTARSVESDQHPGSTPAQSRESTQAGAHGHSSAGLGEERLSNPAQGTESVRIWGATAWMINVFLKQIYMPSLAELGKTQASSESNVEAVSQQTAYPSSSTDSKVNS